MVGRILVGAVDARGAEHVALVGAADDERPAAAHDLGRLAQDHLDDTRIAAIGGALHRLGRRLNVGEIDDAALGLRDGLLRHDEHVTIHERLARFGNRAKQQRDEVVPWDDARGERDRNDLDHASTAAARPVRTAGSFISVGTTTARISSASSSAASAASCVSSTYPPASGCR